MSSSDPPVAATPPPPHGNPPAQPTEAELAALKQSGPLVRFASENIEKLDPACILAISEAQASRARGEWTPAISQKFWSAFNCLCTLVKPVTVDSLTTLHKDLAHKSMLRPWRSPGNESLAERSSRYYMTMLIALLVLVVPLQLLVCMYSNLATDIDQKSNALSVASASFESQFQPLGKRTMVPLGENRKWSDEEVAELDAINLSKEALQDQSSRLNESTSLLKGLLPRTIMPGLSIASLSTTHPSPPVAAGADWYIPCVNLVDEVRATRHEAISIATLANLLNDILLQFVLPVLFGTIGALTYVLRTTSDQIRSFTFSTTSPIRNWVRVLLGALMGVVIGLFSGISHQISLPPLAVAFLAGYGVEAVFSIFDGFITRMRQPSAPEK
jgi:hypothetical protein